MNVTPEMMAEAQSAKSAEELLEKAHAYGVEMTEQQAEEIFAKLHKTGELDDDELDAVAGGKGAPSVSYCPKCGSSSVTVTSHWTYFFTDRFPAKCNSCGAEWTCDEKGNFLNYKN